MNIPPTSRITRFAAMKFARREGVQIVLVTMGHQQVKRELLVHADEIRAVTYP
jgi:hypothetical protein